jgi:uncharacterized lipoprotein YehR (DUF1307 family)
MVQIRTALALALASLLVFPLVGCDSKEGSGSTGKATDAIKDAADKGSSALKDAADKGTGALKDAAGDLVAKAKETFLGEAQTQFDGFKKQIDGWKSKIGSLTGDTKTAAETAMTGISDKVKNVETEMAKVKEGKSDAFESLKGNLTKALGELGDAVKSFADKFKL